MLTDKELLAAVQSSSVINDPAVRELARRFAEDVAAMDADEAAWLERASPVTTHRSWTSERLLDAACMPRSARSTDTPYPCRWHSTIRRPSGRRGRGSR